MPVHTQVHAIHRMRSTSHMCIGASILACVFASASALAHFGRLAMRWATPSRQDGGPRNRPGAPWRRFTTIARGPEEGKSPLGAGHPHIAPVCANHAVRRARRCASAACAVYIAACVRPPNLVTPSDLIVWSKSVAKPACNQVQQLPTHNMVQWVVRRTSRRIDVSRHTT